MTAKQNHSYHKIKVLGSGQDAGIPHIGCYCKICNRARKHEQYQRLGPSISVFDNTSYYLIDASPDIKYQLDMMRQPQGEIPLKGILLTHSHLGHCAGLWYLGKEALEIKNLPVFCTPQMKRFLYENYPFKLLVQRRNIVVKQVYPGKVFRFNNLKCIPIQVPHRNEIADTVGYIIQSNKRVIYLPDIDKWTDNIIKEIRNSDIALIDGTFFSSKELPRFKQVPHPPIQETVEILEDTNTQIYFTHINHTNPVNITGNESKTIKRQGFKVAYDGMVIEI